MKTHAFKPGWRLQYLFLTAVFFILFSDLNAQKETGYNYVSRLMYRIPDSLTRTTHGIAGYVTSHFYTDKDKSRAIYIWICRNIQYNFDSIITNSIYETPAEVSDRLLRTRTGVCLNFAHLFNDLCNKSGIKSYVIQGYTKQNGRVDFLPHIWCAAYIDTAWYLFDPTWGSGYYSRGRWVSQVNGYYFMTRPEALIRSHMPFDPLWQFLDYPITHFEFKNRSYRRDTTKAYFNFTDTLKNWEQSSELERAVGSARRIEKCGAVNNLVEAKLRVVKGEAEYLSNKAAAEKYSMAVDRYNQGINLLNRFIGMINERSSDSLLMTQVLDSSEAHFNSALSILKDAGGFDDHILTSISTLTNEINNTRMRLNLHRATFISQLKTKKVN